MFLFCIRNDITSVKSVRQNRKVCQKQTKAKEHDPCEFLRYDAYNKQIVMYLTISVTAISLCSHITVLV